MTSTLRVERGAQRVSREDLSQFDAPEGTDTWTPVRHSVLVDTMHVELARRGLRVTKEEYAVQRNSNMLFGIMDLDWQRTGEYAAALGLRTSNDKSMSIQLAIGARIFSCTNLVFAGGLLGTGRDLPKFLLASRAWKCVFV